MSIELIVGPPNSGRAEAILGRFRAVLDHEPVLVVPTAGDVAGFERELAASCAPPGGSIATFDALAAEIARALAPSLPPELTVAQREALVRAAIASAGPKRLRRSAARPGFAPALSRLIAELEAALITPGDFATMADELDDPGYERELAAFYSRYVELRDLSRRGDRATTIAAATAALHADPEGWRRRPVYVYGFDDLTRAQLELLAVLDRAADVTVAVTFADRRAFTSRAPLLARLQDELGAEVVERLPFDESYSPSATLRHLDRHLFEPGAGRVAPDEGLVMLESAGPRGEAEAVTVEIARLLRSGLSPDEIVVVLRHPHAAGRLVANVLREGGIPAALESSLPLGGTAVGGSLIALCRAALDERDTRSLLAHLRLDPSVPPGVVDAVEARVKRGQATTVEEAVHSWQSPPRHLARLHEARDRAARLRALARSARELAESAHRERAPLAWEAGEGGVPFAALELRAGVAAAELLFELAGLGELEGCQPPELPGVIEALESASVPLWRGPATGRVRILDPYRARATRARALFCLSLQDGEFPSAAPPDPLLPDERRRRLGHRDLRRADPADEERYLFHSCVSRPTERLYLSWQGCDEDGTAFARSPFLDEIEDLLELDGAELVRARGPERAAPALSEATNDRSLARALALEGLGLDRERVLTAAGVGEHSARIESLFADLPDPCERPGPVRSPVVLAELEGREVFSANSLEGWVTCSYKWFVDHELDPQRLEPTADPLWLGSLVHDALEGLYRDPPGSDSIPRPGDVAAWQRRFGQLLEAAANRSGGPLNHARRAALTRARAQVEAFLAAEAESETEFRPRPDLLEVAFGPFDESEEGRSHEALRLGDVALRGRIDRIDVDAAGRAVVRDYKTGKNVAPAAKFAEQGKLQIQLYMRAAERILGLEPVAGLYHPLGAVGDRKPRGVVSREDDELKTLGVVSSDRLPEDELRRALDEAEELAGIAAGEMRQGRIRRNPIGGRCPKYCTFQAICRLERAVGADENGNDR